MRKALLDSSEDGGSPPAPGGSSIRSDAATIASFPPELPARQPDTRFKAARRAASRFGRLFRSKNSARRHEQLLADRSIDDDGDDDDDNGESSQQLGLHRCTARRAPPSRRASNRAARRFARLFRFGSAPPVLPSNTWAEPSPYLPGNLSFNHVNNWTAASRRRRELRDGPLDVCRWETQSTLGRDVHVHAYNEAKVVHGRALLRSRIIIYRSADPCGHRDATPCLASLFHSHRWPLILCPHTTLRSSSFGGLLCPYPDARHRIADDAALAKHRCVWTHEQPCSRGCPTRTSLRRVLSCTACYTDIYVSAHPVEGSSRRNALMATYWKDLGAGQDEQDIVWQSHMTDERRLLRTGTDHGVFMAYEKRESSVRGRESWTPEVPEASLRIFRDMSNA